MQLDDATAARGVATHSSGNHGAALALAARNRGIRAWVVMPRNAPAVKRAAVAGYGAEIVECEPNTAAREATLGEVLERTGAHSVHPFEDARVICGQGTVGLEIAEQAAAGPPDVVLVPVGGGGLLAGTAVAIAGRLPGCEVIAAEPLGADDAYRSFHGGEWVPQEAPDTIADGLRTSLGRPNFELIQRFVSDVVRVSDAQIIEAMRFVWTRTKQLVEPSGAVPFAALFADPDRFAGRRVAVVASGGNVDLDRLPW
jgi:threonine dehydratase